MIQITKAYAGPNDSVIYEYEDGRREIRFGGSRPWRNNNPGDVVANNIQWNGKVGSAGGFVIFNDPEAGRRVTRIILSNRAKEGKTLAAAMQSYAPSNANPTGAYINNLTKWTGVAADTHLNSLSPAKFEAVIQGIFKQEGWAIGKVRPLNPDGSIATGKYIWNTQGDEKVRESHATRAGEMFSFDDPPEDGNPGEPENCRCWAEPVAGVELGKVFGK